MTKPSTKRLSSPREALALSLCLCQIGIVSLFQPALQVQALPHQGAQHQREDHPQGAAGLQAGAGDGQQAGQTAGRADEQGAQAQTSQDRILVVLLQAAFKKQAQESA